MHLLRARLVGIGPFEDVSFPFSDDEGEPRMMSVVYGAGGVGKTTLLAAIAATRPGYAITPIPDAEPSLGSVGAAAHAVCDWRVGVDDPDRPHPLRVATPTARLSDDPEREMLRKREQALFDRLAKEGGFASVSFSSTRWFSRQPLTFHAPARTIGRYDVRVAAAFDDATRSDLARDTKQALAYAAIARALAATTEGDHPRLELVGQAMQEAVSQLVELAGYDYLGLCPKSFEPLFRGTDGKQRTFDALPTRARHLVAFAALSVRTLAAAYPLRDPLGAEGLVLIDEVDLHQEPSILVRLVPALRAALPNVQWILTTSSPTVANSSDTREVLALRRNSSSSRVELFLGNEARTH